MSILNNKWVSLSFGKAARQNQIDQAAGRLMTAVIEWPVDRFDVQNYLAAYGSMAGEKESFREMERFLNNVAEVAPKNGRARFYFLIAVSANQVKQGLIRISTGRMSDAISNFAHLETNSLHKAMVLLKHDQTRTVPQKVLMISDFLSISGITKAERSLRHSLLETLGDLERREKVQETLQP